MNELAVGVYILEVLVSDVAKLDEVWPQAAYPPVRLSVVLYLCSQVFLQVKFAVVNLPKTALQFLVMYQKAKKTKQTVNTLNQEKTMACSKLGFACAPLQVIVGGLRMAISLELFSVTFLLTTLLLKDEHCLVEGLNRCALHLDLLHHKEETPSEPPVWAQVQAFSKQSWTHLGGLCEGFVETIKLL